VTILNNGLILKLAQEDQNQVQNICTPVSLFAGQILCSPGHIESAKVYFLADACVALLVKNQKQNTLAVGLVGSEGAIGLGAILTGTPENMRFEVQTTGMAWAAEQADVALLLHQRPGMLWVISQYLWQLTEHVATMAASAQFNDINTRLAHWLVLSATRAQSHRLQLTQEHLAEMLGVRRVSITLSACDLKDRGLIRYQRGILEILDMAQLRQMAHHYL
jgi:CRP-like cAMP-binding protein